MKNVIFVSIVALAACSSSSQALRLETAVALQDGSALLVWRTEHREQFLTRVSRGGDELWRQPISGHAKLGWGMFSIWTTDDLVGFREFDEESPLELVVVEAFSLASGERAWATGLTSLAGTRGYAFGAERDTFGTRGYRYEVVPGPEGTMLVALDATRGTLLRRDRIDDLPRVAATGSGAWLLLRGGETWWLDGASYQVHRAGGLWHVCASTAQVVGLTHRIEGLFVADNLDLSRSWKIESAELRDANAESCALYRDRVVIEAIDEDRTTLWSATRDGHIAHVGFDGRTFDTGRREGPNGLVGTKLLRFVPYVASRRDASTQLVLVDLDRMEIVSTSEVPRFTSAFQVDRRWYVTDDEGRIAVIDGDTGRLLGAKRFPQLDMRWIGPNNVAGGSVWLGPMHAWVERPIFARLDATTLEPGFMSAAVTIEDATNDSDLGRLPR